MYGFCVDINGIISVDIDGIISVDIDGIISVPQRPCKVEYSTSDVS
jgi:hypothetical protein